MANKNSFQGTSSAGISNASIQAIRAAQATAPSTDPLGESSRLARLLTQLDKLLSERYAFDAFTGEAINCISG